MRNLTCCPRRRENVHRLEWTKPALRYVQQEDHSHGIFPALTF